MYDIEKATGIPWRKKKSYRYLYRMACQKPVIIRAFKRMRRGKGKREKIQEIEQNFDVWVDKIQKIIENTKPDGWRVEHPELAFDPPKHKPLIIRERGKIRVIYTPSTAELWIQHIIVLILEPIIAGSSYHHSYSSFPKKGSHRGMKAVKRWIKRGNGIRNFAQCDIRHFYNHIQYKYVRKCLERRVHDNMFLHLIDVCLKWFPRELPLGFYVSQWFANFMLQELDYKIKCKLKIAHYVRYMDNFTLTDDNKKKLHHAVRYIKKWLGKMRLKMKGDWQVFRFDYKKKNGRRTGRDVQTMGWRFFRDRTIMKKHTMIHVSRNAKNLYRKKIERKRYPLKLCRGFISLMGWVKHSDTYEWYLMNIKPFADIRKIRKIISKADKTEKEEKKMQDWKEERCSHEPKEIEEISAESVIERKNIEKVEHEATDSIDAYEEYTCLSRIMTKSEYHMLKSIEDIETEKAVSAAIDDYTLQLIEGGAL